MTDEKARRKLEEMYDNMGSYSAVAQALRVDRWAVHKAVVYGTVVPDIKRALEYTIWSGVRRRVRTDNIGTAERVDGLSGEQTG